MQFTTYVLSRVYQDFWMLVDINIFLLCLIIEVLKEKSNCYYIPIFGSTHTRFGVKGASPLECRQVGVMSCSSKIKASRPSEGKGLYRVNTAYDFE